MKVYYILTMGGFPRIRWPSVPAPAPVHFPAIHIPAPPPPKPVIIHLPPALKPLHIPLPPPPRIAPLPPIHIDIPKPKIDMAALQKFTGALAGAVAVTPMGKVMMMGITGIADASTGGKASDYLNSGMKVNSTLSMLPGGVLVQRLANDATNGKSGDTLAKFVPDPVHLAIADAKIIGKTLVTDPKNTISATKGAIQDNRSSLIAIGTNNTHAITTIVTPTTMSRAVSVMEKPSLITMVSTVVKPASTLSAAPSTLKTSLLSAVAEVPKLPSLSTPLAMIPVAAMSTISHDITASVVKPLTGSTLPIVGKNTPSSVSNEPVISTLSKDTELTPAITSTLTNTLSVAPITPVIVPGSTTLSKSSAPVEPSTDVGYLPIIGVLGAIGLFMMR